MMRYQSTWVPVRRIISNIQASIQFALSRTTFKLSPSDQELSAISSFGYHPVVKKKALKLVRWIPPLGGYCLNVDGASKGNPGVCGGGGCIRDAAGNLVIAFAHFYSMGNSLIAEVRALCDGLRMAADFGLKLESIQSDSALLVESLRSNIPLSWDTIRWWRMVVDLLKAHSIPVTHVYREGNRLADSLASHACSSNTNTVFPSVASMPRACRGNFALDKARLSSVGLV